MSILSGLMQRPTDYGEYGFHEDGPAPFEDSELEQVIKDARVWLKTHTPRIIPVEPPDVNINKKRSPKNAELVLSCNKLGFPRYELNQLKIFVPVGKDIKIVTPVK